MDQDRIDDWKSALFSVRTQIADYEREGTSTPGKLKRAARLRACRIALRDISSRHESDVKVLKLSLNEIERAEKEDNWRHVSVQIGELLAMVDGMIGAAGSIT